MYLSELQKNNQDEINRLRAQQPNWTEVKEPFLMGSDYAF